MTFSYLSSYSILLYLGSQPAKDISKINMNKSIALKKQVSNLKKKMSDFNHHKCVIIK